LYNVCNILIQLITYSPIKDLLLSYNIIMIVIQRINQCKPIWLEIYYQLLIELTKSCSPSIYPTICTIPVLHVNNDIKHLLESCIENVINNNMNDYTLQIIGNLIRLHTSIKTYVKSLSNIKLFYRTLITLLSHINMNIVLHS